MNTVLIWLQADLGYKPRPQTSPKNTGNLINTNCKYIILGYKPRAIFEVLYIVDHEIFVKIQSDNDCKIILKAIK